MMFTQFLILALVAIVALDIGVVLLLRRKTPNAVGGLLVLVSIIAVWILAYLVHILYTNYMPLEFLTSINYLCLVSAASAQLFLSFSFTNRTHWLTPFPFSFFLIEPILTQILFWNDLTRRALFDPENGLWEQINLIYIFQLLAASILLFANYFLNKPRPQFQRVAAIMLGATIPLLGTVLMFITKGEFESHIYIAIISYSLAIAGFSYGKLNYRLVEKSPLTRDIVVEGMDDGWMVVDHYDKVIDVNPSAERLIGMSREDIYGLPVDQILSEWPKVFQFPEGVKEMEMRRIVKAQSDSRYLNIRISRLSMKNNSQFGHLIVWRDITGRKLADEAHQRTRDELFVLLNAISSMANRSLNLTDFLSESSYQIVYSFHSVAIAVFLTEEKDGTRQKLSLKSHFGFSPEQVNAIKSKSNASNIYAWLLGNEENRPLVLDYQLKSPNVPMNPANVGFNYVVLIPLIIYTQHENRLLGCLCLARNEDSAYSQDEVIRLTTIANQIATLIDSSRRRQFAIALGERQRLLRDLHDSVSQKLYGLVALTEAAQAGIEAGSEIAPLDVLTRIGENARQAVKEMRLFLYEMQPIDLKDGLVSSLQHRLAAVEGRADIKARMISDENIQLEKEKEIVLYYIAQEALNNILRHAHARNVSVNLKQIRQNVILEITDDGKGFEIKKIDNSGLGLRNMKERISLANGKLKITSKIGIGTKILVTVARKSSL